jgi:tetratricopeptide (TPR) repeat protein
MSLSLKRSLWLMPPTALALMLTACTISQYEHYASEGVAHYQKKDYKKAEESFLLAVKDAEQTGQEPLVNKSLINLANVEDKLGKSADAVLYGERAIKIAEKIYPPDDRTTIEQMQFVASLYMKEARFPEGQKLLERVLSQGDKGLTATGKAAVRGNLALMLRAQGRLQEAEAANKEVLKIYEKELKPDDYHIGVALINLASNYMDGGKLDEARTNTERGLSILRKTPGMENVQLAMADAQLAMIYWRHGKKSEAEAIYRKAVPALEQVNKNYAVTKLGLRYPPTVEQCSKLFAEKYEETRKAPKIQ